LAMLLPAAGDGRSSATARGGNGSLLAGVGVPRANAVLTPVVEVCLGWSAVAQGCASGATSTSVTGGRDVRITSASDSAASAYADNRSGGAVQTGVARAKVESNPTTRVLVAAGTEITAGRDLTLGADADISTGTTAIAKGGGGVVS